jgi:polysaccharide export outer membrane protein
MNPDRARDSVRSATARVCDASAREGSMMDAKARRAMVAALVATGLALSGCATTNGTPTAETATAIGAAEESAATAETAANPPALVAAPASSAVIAPAETYRIGVDDELEVSVYGFEGLSIRQVVRPDGRIEMPVAGEIQAQGLTPAELRERVARDLAGSFANPNVTVIVRDYGSRRINVIGQVLRPGSLTLDADRSLLHTLALAGGLTERADLRGVLLVREGVAQPLNLENLLWRGDLTQNVELQPNDTLIIPDVTDRKAIVLGEVAAPQVVSLRGDVTVMEVVARAQGFKRSSARSRLRVLRGGAADPQVFKINADDVIGNGDLAQNMLLQDGDIVYVPKTIWATVIDTISDVTGLVQPTLFWNP